MNTETQNSPKRTAQEIAEQHRAARKQFRASPEGQKVSAEAARLLAIAKAKDEAATMDAETIEALLKRDRDRTRSAEAEKMRIAADAEAQRQRAEVAEIEAEQLKNRFGLAYGQTDFSKGELYKIAKKNRYEATESGFYSALRSQGFEGRTRLLRADAEEFLSVLLSNQRPKRAL